MDKETFEKVAKISKNMKSLWLVIVLIYAIILIVFAVMLFNN